MPGPDTVRGETRMSDPEEPHRNKAPAVTSNLECLGHNPAKQLNEML